MWVANITDECILGLDFLEKYGCHVCLKDRILVIGNQQIPLTCSSPDIPRCCRVIAKESCTVEPWTEAIVPGQVISRVQSRWGVLGDNTSQIESGLLVGRCLIDLEKDTVPVRVLNPSSQEYRVQKGADISHCEPVAGVFLAPIEVNEASPTAENLKVQKLTLVIATNTPSGSYKQEHEALGPSTAEQGFGLACRIHRRILQEFG